MSDAKQHNPIVQLRSDIKAALPTFGLPDERSQQRMSSVLMVAVERDPELVFADRQSLIAAVRQCANHGLVPDGNEATLQVYNTKVKTRGGKEEWVKKVQYQPMVRGIINRVLQSGKVRTFWAEIVYDGEEFSIDASDGERRPIHKKFSEFQRGTDKSIIGAYSVAKLRDGTVDCEVMPRSEIEKVRAVAKTTKVWDGWFSEKAKVAVLRRHSKRLPLSAEDLDMIMNRQETDFDRLHLRDVTPKPDGFAAMAQKAREEPPVHDVEILPDDEIPEFKDEPEDDEPDMNSFEFDEGIFAATGGKPVSACPYPDDPTKMRDWLAGHKHYKESKK